MKHSGTELKKRKKINPYPNWADIVKQNEWLRSNMFDSLGSSWKIKRNECQNPITEFTKLEVEEQRHAHKQSSFKRWWRSLSPSLIVEVRYPHERHGSNSNGPA